MPRETYKITEEQINNLLNNELKNIKSKIELSNKILIGRTDFEVYPRGEHKNGGKTDIKISRQIKNTKEYLIDTLLH